MYKLRDSDGGSIKFFLRGGQAASITLSKTVEKEKLCTFRGVEAEAEGKHRYEVTVFIDASESVHGMVLCWKGDVIPQIGAEAWQKPYLAFRDVDASILPTEIKEHLSDFHLLDWRYFSGPFERLKLDMEFWIADRVAHEQQEYAAYWK